MGLYYKLTCSCGSSYIGQTRRMLSKRPVLRFTAALFFLLKLFSSYIYCIPKFKQFLSSLGCVQIKTQSTVFEIEFKFEFGKNDRVQRVRVRIPA